jgi:hypothetical protein
MEVSPTWLAHELQMTPRSATLCKYLGQEYRIHLRAVLKVLQNTHPLNLPCLSVDVWFFQFFRIRLGSPPHQQILLPHGM